MSFLLDTHVFLWLLTGDQRLPTRWLAELQNSSNAVFLSVASTWEATIKFHSGRLPLPEHPVSLFPVARARHMIGVLAIDEDTILFLASLPAYHKDPFDHILLAQAIQHDLVLMTVDANMRKYPARFADLS